MIYFDNAATTYPKPKEVYDALDYANRNLAFNAGRGEYKESTLAFNLIDNTRNKLATLINARGEDVVFTSSATESLNIIINGLDINDGDFIYVSPFEHNAVIRPLKYLQKTYKFEIRILPFDKETWEIKKEEMQTEFAMHHPKAVFVSHISNVTGYVLPYELIFEASSKWSSINVLDCSQSFGIINPKDISNINYLIFAGHKSLYASFGVAGFFKLSDDELKVTKAGGTGSDSLNFEMPKLKPYRYEAGSSNIVAIYGLNKSIDWLKTTNIESTEKQLMRYLIDQLLTLKKVKIFKPKELDNFGVISIAVDGYISEDVATILNDEYDICVRAGFHCAPLVHDFINSNKYNGTVRISLNYFNSKTEIDKLIEGLKSL